MGESKLLVGCLCWRDEPQSLKIMQNFKADIANKTTASGRTAEGLENSKRRRVDSDLQDRSYAAVQDG